MSSKPKPTGFLKREPILTISFIAALLSLIAARPSGELFVNLSWKTLALLFMLFTSLEGLKRERVFDPIINLAAKLKSTFLLSLFLITVVFFISMLVTNDVALLTFVPITITILKRAERENFIIPDLVLMTIAANLGSMLTPFGNPQNLFLYDKMGLTGGRFTLMLLPLALISYTLLLLSLLLVFRKDLKSEIILKSEMEPTESNSALRMFYICMLLLSILTVLGVFPTPIIFILFLLMIVAFDRRVLARVDYALLATFLCFFIFSSSISSLPKVRELLEMNVSGHEFILGLLLSQIISNVPAAILLEPYSTSLRALLFGVDIGGLGTVAASLASLITLKLYSKESGANTKHFIGIFTLLNGIFLIVLVISALLLLK